MAKAKSWKKLITEKSDKEILELVMKTYIKDRGLNNMAKEYDVKTNTIRVYMHKNKDLLENELSVLYDFYKEIAHEIRKPSENKESDKRDIRELLQELPQVITYDKFLEEVLTANTGTATGNQLIRMANRFGIKVLDRRNKIIKV